MSVENGCLLFNLAFVVSLPVSLCFGDVKHGEVYRCSCLSLWFLMLLKERNMEGGHRAVVEMSWSLPSGLFSLA